MIGGAAILPGIAPNWRIALGAAAVGHVALGTFVLAGTPAAPAPLPDPVMVIELPAGAAPAPAAATTEQPVQEMPRDLPQMVTPRIEVPEVSAPLPPEPVAVPTRRPLPPRVAPQQLARPATPASVSAPSAQIAPPTATASQGTGPGSDPRARADQADWYALISAHLERNKRYPREARRDGLQGTPTVRFTVDRRGRVSDVSITGTSGHPSLDEATEDLLRRVSPLPAMPRSMARESVTITLPIEYSLSRK